MIGSVLVNCFLVTFSHILENSVQLQLSRIMREPTICICKNKDADQLRGNGNHEADQRTAKLISAFVFATWIVQSLYFLNTKFPASSPLQ